MLCNSIVRNCLKYRARAAVYPQQRTAVDAKAETIDRRGSSQFTPGMPLAFAYPRNIPYPTDSTLLNDGVLRAQRRAVNGGSPRSEVVKNLHAGVVSMVHTEPAGTNFAPQR